MTMSIESYESDDCGFDEREAAEVRAEEQALYGDPMYDCAYDKEAADISFDD